MPKGGDPHASAFWKEYREIGTLAQQLTQGAWTREQAQSVLGRLKTMEGCARMLLEKAPLEAAVPLPPTTASFAADSKAASEMEVDTSVLDQDLIVASGLGELSKVEALLAKGASVEEIDENGYTALHLAAKKGHTAVARVLVDAGADLKMTTYAGLTAVFLATKYEHDELAEVLQGLMANVAATTRRDVTVPSEFVEVEQLLGEAAKAGELATVEQLLSQGVSVPA